MYKPTRIKRLLFIFIKREGRAVITKCQNEGPENICILL